MHVTGHVTMLYRVTHRPVTLTGATNNSGQDRLQAAVPFPDCRQLDLYLLWPEARQHQGTEQKHRFPDAPQGAQQHGDRHEVLQHGIQCSCQLRS